MDSDLSGGWRYLVFEQLEPGLHEHFLLDISYLVTYTRKLIQHIFFFTEKMVRYLATTISSWRRLVMSVVHKIHIFTVFVLFSYLILFFVNVSFALTK